jgi:hypothetical protein
MPNIPKHPTRQEIEQDEKTRQQFEADTLSRHSDVLPMGAARNEKGRFYGELIRGERSRNGARRIGFFLVGFLICSLGILIVIDAGESTPMVFLPFGAFAILLGVKIIVSAPKRKS